MNRELHAIGLSGGKDSTALAMRLREVEPQEYVYLCTPTGDELPEMAAHWDRLECLLGQPLLRLRADMNLNTLIEREQMLPNWRARFCTRKLKIDVCQRWISEQTQAAGRRVILNVGLRADEEGREGGIYDNCEVRFPFREWGWGVHEVLRYLQERGVSIPARTDCARCFFQSLPEWWSLWKDYPAIYADAEAQERRFGHTFRSPGRDTWPASLDMLRAKFERGHVPRGTKLNGDLFGFEDNKCRICSL